MSRFAAAVVLVGLIAFFLPMAKRVPAGPQVGPLKSDAIELKGLQKERIKTLTHLVEMLRLQYEKGGMDFRRLATAEMELVNAKTEAAESREEIVALLEELGTLAKGVLEFTETRQRAGFRTSQVDVYEAKSLYLAIKIRLVQERAKLKPPAH